MEIEAILENLISIDPLCAVGVVDLDGGGLPCLSVDAPGGGVFHVVNRN
ncbi:hypothetical protein DSOL_4978 [Desulfosporosinus metallidurans]|uniref:Uncharacterized protein n=1 Tax=Desulfosporosinus metallidurans TaxID=1888891 RepID=A0A1Q8QF35_9FIRM|nr:hypothetical protein DSOL_5177 [Desulfosporosinus metallidurans]OLN26444.1 hypothetical protein DSOL_4978 [Desulfosporosinus metallidurans]